MASEYLCEPCRNFCFMTGCLVKTRDGRQKMVLASFVAGGTGAIVFVDLQSFESEMMMLPSDEGGEKFLDLNDEKLLVGTSIHQGCLHSLDLKTMEWAEPLRYKNEVWILDMALASDGYVYVTTYSGCLLLRYDTKCHTLELVGRVSKSEQNLFGGQIFAGIPGKLFLNSGLEHKETVQFDIATQTFTNVFEPGTWVTHVGADHIRTTNGDRIVFYDPQTLTEIQHEEVVVDDPRLDEYMNVFVTTENGMKAGVRGQMVFTIGKDDAVADIRQVELEPLPTNILTLETGDDGRIWGSTTLGQTIFSYDTATGKYWNSLNVCSRNGEVYGMKMIGGRLFMAGYALGEHIVYDPSLPWNQLDNVNPNTFFLGRPKLVRPNAKSTIGPDGAFWTGWMQTYGTYGCGISRVDPATLKTDVWTDLVPMQGSRSIAAGDKYIYFSTYGAGNGLPPRGDDYCLIAFDTSCREIKRRTYPRNVIAGGLVWCSGLLLTCRKDLIEILNGDDLETVFEIPINGYFSASFKYDDGHVGGFLDGDFVLVEVKTGTITHREPVEAHGSTAVRGLDGNVYYANGTKLYRIDTGKAS